MPQPAELFEKYDPITADFTLIVTSRSAGFHQARKRISYPLMLDA
jgi:hypothetical protein